jgi:hypothetical protein
MFCRSALAWFPTAAIAIANSILRGLYEAMLGALELRPVSGTHIIHVPSDCAMRHGKAGDVRGHYPFYSTQIYSTQKVVGPTLVSARNGHFCRRVQFPFVYISSLSASV